MTMCLKDQCLDRLATKAQYYCNYEVMTDFDTKFTVMVQ